MERLKEDGEGSAYDQETLSTIKMNNTTVLYLREVNKYVQFWFNKTERPACVKYFIFFRFRFLALVCILREENFDKRGLIDYNFLCFRSAIQEVGNP